MVEIKTTDRLISQPEVREITGRAANTIYRWWHDKNVLPKPIVINGRNYWRASTIEALLDGKTAA